MIRLSFHRHEDARAASLYRADASPVTWDNARHPISAQSWPIGMVRSCGGNVMPTPRPLARPGIVQPDRYGHDRKEIAVAHL
jgi:hypothetical protein